LNKDTFIEGFTIFLVLSTLMTPWFTMDAPRADGWWIVCSCFRGRVFSRAAITTTGTMASRRVAPLREACTEDFTSFFSTNKVSQGKQPQRIKKERGKAGKTRQNV
jgi:hypothetical protein